MIQRTHSSVSPRGNSPSADPDSHHDARDRGVHTSQAPGLGDVIGHYRIVSERGDDDLGRIYVAEQHGIRGVSKTVSLRCVHPELARSRHFRELFAEAARIAPRFEHPNVLTVFEMGEVNGICFISTEYVPGETLVSILTRRTVHAFLPPDIAAYVVKQTALAVQYLHGFDAAAARHAGIGRGAVDPFNVFVTFNGTVKLLSVGFPARAGDGTEAAHLVSPSPPRASGAAEPSDARDPRADVFNLGTLLWTCLTGQRFPHDAAEVDAAAPRARWVAPSSVRADVPDALEAITLQALSADPRERFQSVHALSEALDRYLIRRDSRLTPKHLRRWLELPTTGLRPRQLWSTSHGAFSRLSRGSIAPSRPSDPGSGSGMLERLSLSAVLPRPLPSALAAAPSLPTRAAASVEAPPVRRPPAWMVGAMLGICAVIAIASAVVMSSSGESSPVSHAAPGSPAARHDGRVEVRSMPEGAAVFVDGEPTGLRTPVVLKGLADGHSLRLRVDKAGFASQEREITVVAGSVEAQTFELLASDGLVHFAGVPAGASIYVDDVEVRLDERPLELSVGRHRVRVETTGSLIFSDTVLVVAGEQTIRIDGAKAAP
jgi:serine/threonine protein kinase